MPTIYDNIEKHLLPELQATLNQAQGADFSIGYFNLRGWRALACQVEHWPEGAVCRILIGMQRPDRENLETLFGLRGDEPVDRAKLLQARRELIEEFRRQLTVGLPTSADEVALRDLIRHIRQGKVQVKLFLRHPLHAKLYLVRRADHKAPLVGYVGSSNLTFSGLSGQGELNLDVVDQDAALKLEAWFADRWNDRFCLELTDDLLTILEESWASETLRSPYHIYLKIAYHLSREARAGIAEFQLPRNFPTPLFEFQAAAVKIAAHHLVNRGGVMIGDVVGLGKTMMASALIRTMEDQYFDTLILCPVNLVPMWEQYRRDYGLRAEVMAQSQARSKLPDLRRYRLVVIDESHNLRNREGKTYAAIRDYITRNDSHVVLLTATPYNKTYLDLSSQLRLFLPEERDIGIRPEAYLRTISDGEIGFVRKHQCAVRSIRAFEHSDDADDWRDLMRLFLVRRTRTFIQNNYTEFDEARQRSYLAYPNGQRYYFPVRQPRTLAFPVDDQYASLYSTQVVDVIDGLRLPRYGLGNYVTPLLEHSPSAAELNTLKDLSRAGERLKGFVRTNFFKRLESSGFAFLQSVERHIRRNGVLLHALANGLPVPVGSQDAALLDSIDEDESSVVSDVGNADDTARLSDEGQQVSYGDVYQMFSGQYHNRFKWLPAELFTPALSDDLQADNDALQEILAAAGRWQAQADAKLATLHTLLSGQHGQDKVLIFTQFADTARYLERELTGQGVTRLASVTGESRNPTELARRFAPQGQRVQDELRVLIATDVLSEGQNLQDAFVVVNYDLPWAIIRLIQRAGRVDRIGQQSDTVHAYSFIPSDGVEKLIGLRARVSSRLRDAGQVVGGDEAFFDDEEAASDLRDLYNEKAGILDEVGDGEVDLASEAYQIWKNATDADPGLLDLIPKLPSVVYATRSHTATPAQPSGALVYLRTPQGNDALAWLDEQGGSVTESQIAILRAAACHPATPALPPLPNHHELVERAARRVVEEEASGSAGALGTPGSTRRKLYERLKHIQDTREGSLFTDPELKTVLEDLLAAPLQEAARNTLGGHFRSRIGDDALIRLVVQLHQEGRLTVPTDDLSRSEPEILCSLGLTPM
ncbi:helicase-related protein [Deinococcus budaensis]|uniref:Superfamily II DNA or RNA helicase n=1 Tax=Deinococcus budaensis TaxID=1665626 RepID=A0A7W8GIM7_9DEIO|nr:helicase-related protein [Deinococcus budaensis]MBB5235958.1 superfamily II DNA or RNA helicase [Deinococcus budaensis]